MCTWCNRFGVNMPVRGWVYIEGRDIMRAWSSAGMGGGDRYGMGTSVHTQSHTVMWGSFPSASPFVPTSGKALSRVLDSLSSFSHQALDPSPSILLPTYNMILRFILMVYKGFNYSLHRFFSFTSLILPQFTLLFGGWNCSCMIKLNNYYTYGT